MPLQKREWYALDNAANIYPVIQSKQWTPMFRLTAVMAAPVDTVALQTALNKMRPRFPGFYVRLKRGVFWYYLEQEEWEARVEQDTLYPCPPLSQEELPFRIKVHQNRIAGEFAHVVCDGTGGMIFFQTLLAQYLREQGVRVPYTESILNLGEAPEAGEQEDSFLRYYRTGARLSRKEPLAYKMEGTRLLPGMYCVTTGVMSVENALALARKHQVSLTEYMTATLLYVLYTVQKAVRPRGRLKPVKISVPVNLRKYYNTKTLRNFSQYLNPGIDASFGDFTFEETLTQVHHYFRYMFTEKNLNARMSINVLAQRNPILRVMPLFLKKAGIRLVYNATGETVFTAALSNVGALSLPEEMHPHVRRCDLLLCTAKHNAVQCGMMSYQDTLSISFARSIAEPYVERLFFRALVRQGLHVCVESNQL